MKRFPQRGGLMKIFCANKLNTLIEIRSIDKNDEKRLFDFYDNLSEETFRSFYRGIKNKRVSEQQWKIINECDFDPKKYLLLAAIHHDKIIGLGMLRLDHPARKDYEVGHLVSDGYQKKGIGSQLMEELLLFAKNNFNGGNIVAHTTFMNVGAKKLLRKFSFILNKIDEDELVWTLKV